jgi:hypothetical protein
LRDELRRRDEQHQEEVPAPEVEQHSQEWFECLAEQDEVRIVIDPSEDAAAAAAATDEVDYERSNAETKRGNRDWNRLGSRTRHSYRHRDRSNQQKQAKEQKREKKEKERKQEQESRIGQLSAQLQEATQREQ